MRQIVENLGSGNGTTYLVSDHAFESYNVQIVKVQRTKTQATFCVRVLNFYAGNRPHLQIPCETLKSCKAIVKHASETGTIHLWTGHTCKVGSLLNSK